MAIQKFRDGLVFIKGFCQQCSLRKIPGNERKDCLDLIEELTGKKIDCALHRTFHFKDLGAEKTKGLKKERF